MKTQILNSDDLKDCTILNVHYGFAGIFFILEDNKYFVIEAEIYFNEANSLIRDTPPDLDLDLVRAGILTGEEFQQLRKVEATKHEREIRKRELQQLTHLKEKYE